MTKLLATDRILANRPGDPTVIVNRLMSPDTKDVQYIWAMVKWCDVAGIDPFIALTQWLVETDNGRSPRWNNDLNPGGVGIPSDSTVQPFEIKDGDEAARIHVQALYSCVTKRLHPDVPIPIESEDWFRLVWLPKVTHPNYPGVTIVDDLNTRYQANGDAHATWAWDAEYISTLIARCSVFYPDLQPQTVGGEPVVIDVNFRVSIIPQGNSNRPGFLLNTDDRLIGITQHATGNTNPGATADMHRVFVHNGGGPDNVSFPFVVDDHEIIQLLPVYEGAYHAADGCDDRATDVGCFDTVAIELCVYAGQNWAKAKDNLAKLYGMLWTGDKRIVGIERVTVENGRVYTHQQVSDTNKYCPTQLLNEGSLPVIIAQGKQYAGTAGPAQPTYAKPSVPDWLANDDGVSVETINRAKVYPVHLTYKALRDTPRRQATGTNKNLVGPDIKQGEVFQAARAYRSAGKTYILTTYGTRVAAADLMPKVQITTSGTVSIRYE